MFLQGKKGWARGEAVGSKQSISEGNTTHKGKAEIWIVSESLKGHCFTCTNIIRYPLVIIKSPHLQTKQRKKWSPSFPESQKAPTFNFFFPIAVDWLLLLKSSQFSLSTPSLPFLAHKYNPISHCLQTRKMGELHSLAYTSSSLGWDFHGHNHNHNLGVPNADTMSLGTTFPYFLSLFLSYKLVLDR